MRNRLRIWLAASWIAGGFIAGPAALAAPPAATMSYFYSVYDKVVGVKTDAQGVPDELDVNSALSGMEQQLYGHDAKPIDGYSGTIYVAALEEFDRELQTYDELDAKSQAIDEINQAAASAWVDQVGGMAVAACKQLAAAGVEQGSWTMSFSCLNPGIPSSAASIVVLANAVWPGKYRLPPGPRLVPDPYNPQYPSFAFILANYMTYFHLHPDDRQLLGQTPPLYPPIVAALPLAIPGVAEALSGHAESFQVPFLVSQSDMADYQADQDAAWERAGYGHFNFNTTDATAQGKPPIFIPRVVGLPPGGGTSPGGTSPGASGSPSGANGGGPPSQLPS